MLLVPARAWPRIPWPRRQTSVFTLTLATLGAALFTADQLLLGHVPTAEGNLLANLVAAMLVFGRALAVLTPVSAIGYLTIRTMWRGLAERRLVGTWLGWLIASAVVCVGAAHLVATADPTSMLPIEGRPESAWAVCLLFMQIVAIMLGLGLIANAKIGCANLLTPLALLREPRHRRNLAFGALMGVIGAGLLFAMFFAISEFAPWLNEAPAETAPAIPTAMQISLSEAPRVLRLAFVSAKAGVVEELVFRLGLMGLLLWAGVNLARRSGQVSSSVPTAVFLGANLISALLFAAAHGDLGAVSMFYRTMFGLTCGWLYWRRGIGTAITAHFSLDFSFFVTQLALLNLAEA